MTATDPAALTARLSEIVGLDHTVSGPSLLVGDLSPSLSIAPASLEEAARALLAVREAGAAVVPWGGGSQQRAGAPPTRADLLLCTHRWLEIVDWEPADLTAGLSAGLTLREVQTALAAHGQQLPIDAPVAERATIGGLVATNTAGPRRWQHGGWRDLIIGMHVVLSDGTVITTGGRVVKNVQGYDLAKLFTGSLGTLGVIGRVNVKVAPLPAARRLVVARGALLPLSGYLQEVAAGQLRVTALDLLDGEAARRLGLEGAGWAALTLTEGSKAVVDAATLAAERTADAAGLRHEAVDGPALDAIWSSWVDLGRSDDLQPEEALFAVAARPSEVSEVMLALEEIMTRCRLAGPLWARAGNGSVFARLRHAPEKADTLAAAQEALLRRWPAVTVTAGSSATARLVRPWGAEPEGFAVMSAIKARFDPAAILQPGRFVGGM